MRGLVLLVSAIVLLDTAFYSAVAPLLPHYTDELDLSKSAAGILTGSYAAGCFVGTIPAIWLSGRAGVKATTIIGLAGLSATSVLFGLANEIWLLDAARFVQGIASACTWTAGFAWIVERSPPERRGEVIGTPLGAAIAGALVGPVLGAAATEVGPEVVFSGVAFGAALLAVIAAREAAVPAPKSDLRSAAAATRVGSIQLGMWLVTLPALGWGVVNVLVPLRLDELGAAAFGIGAVYLIAAGLEAALSPYVGRVSDRRGRLYPVRAGLIGAAILIPLLPLPESAELLAVLVIVAAMFSAAFWAPSMALLSDEVERAGVQHAVAFAFTNVAWSVGQVVGNAGGSRLAEATTDTVSYLVVAALFVVTLLGLSRRRHFEPAQAAPAAASSPPSAAK